MSLAHASDELREIAPQSEAVRWQADSSVSSSSIYAAEYEAVAFTGNAAKSIAERLCDDVELNLYSNIGMLLLWIFTLIITIFFVSASMHVGEGKLFKLSSDTPVILIPDA